MEEKGCLMAFFNIPNWDDFLEHIDDNDVYFKDDDYGKEYQPHVTLLYGFIHNDDVFNKLEKLKVKSIKCEITGLDIFENEEFDVLHFSVQSESMFIINNYLKKNFEYKNDYDEYKPHMTICYLKKGLGDKYLEKLMLSKNIQLSTNRIIYSYNDVETNINEKREIKYMDGSKSVEVKDECKLGGQKNGTSKQCNQGDINVLKIKNL